MEPNKQKHKKNHVVIVTSNAADAQVKQFQIRPWLLWVVVVTICVVIGAGFGYLLYQDQIKSAANKRIEQYRVAAQDFEKELQKQIDFTESESKRFEKEIEQLEKEKEILSTTVQLKNAELEELNGEIAQMHNPTLLPLTGTATIEEVKEETPKCVFHAAEGALVVSTASGTVTEIVEVPEEGYKVSVDHGNGYVTIYHNTAVPKVKQGDEVLQGATVFVVERTNLTLGYQIKKDGTFMNPMEIMEING